MLVDVDLTGILVGASLATRAPDIYRTLIEATAFGTRVIVDALEQNDVPVNELVACGGLPEKESAPDADLCGCDGTRVQDSRLETDPTLGAAMFGAVAAGSAAGGYDSIFDATPRMARLNKKTFKPNPKAQKVYDELYAEYLTLHDYFGRGTNDVMKRLKHVRAAAHSEARRRG